MLAQPALALFEAVARRGSSVDGASLLAGFCFVLQFGCSLDDRQVVTADNTIQSAGGAAGAANPGDTTPPMPSGGSAGAGLGGGGAANPGEVAAPPRLTEAGDAGAVSALPTGAPLDAGSTATPPEPPPSPVCDTSQPFQVPVPVPGLTSEGEEYGIWLTPDELTAYFASDRGDLGGPGDYDLYRARRSAIAEPFAQPSLVPILNTAFSERKAVLAVDGLRLFFSSDRPGLGAGEDIYVSTRPNTLSDFGVPGLLSGINSAQGDLVHSVSSDGRYLYFDRPATSTERDIFLFDLSTATPTGPVTELVSVYDEGHAVASADDLTVYWATTRVSLNDSDGDSESDIWSARRASPGDPLGGLTPVAELNSPSAETVHFVSADGCRIYIGSERSGRGQLYVAAKP
jgi:hypothetical protein